MFFAAILVVLGLGAPARAHPHIFIDAEVGIVFGADGAIERLAHEWTFDAFFSAWMVQGLDTDGDGVVSSAELSELADENMVGLAQYSFYTFAGVDGRDLTFRAVGDQVMRHEDGRVTLAFSVAPTEAVPLADTLELAVNDPEYYVAITFADISTVRLENPPDTCRAELEPPRPIPPEVEQRLYALGPEVLELPPDLAAAMRGSQGMVLVRCAEGGRAETASEAAAALADARPTPFGGPPPEPGLSLPRTGFFGWLQDQQRDFYLAMTAALDALRTDWTAFWVLGGLSFAYGVFHAAGPGHGKVVISSYVLANESQLRRGVALSMLSAFVQALTAIGFVLIAAGLMGLTSLAMGDATHWIGFFSYGLVAALGAWLIVRKLSGRGHHHHHDHDHDHGHAHHHVVGPEATRGSWREQLGVVLAVGLRPCTGALVVLVFALSQGVLAAGILATLLMGLGTGITVAALASLAVGAKGLARRIGGGAGSATANAVLWWLELVGAMAVFAFGVLLLIASL